MSYRLPHDRITIDPAICHGEPIITGTRVTVRIIMGSIAGGMSLEDIASEYDLEIEDIYAAMTYALSSVPDDAA
jgi:uncharacterized protein (DUF433 family)